MAKTIKENVAIGNDVGFMVIAEPMPEMRYNMQRGLVFRETLKYLAVGERMKVELLFAPSARVMMYRIAKKIKRKYKTTTTNQFFYLERIL